MKFRSLLPLLLILPAEAGAQVQTGPRFVVSTLADRNNGTALTGDCTLREAIGAAATSGQPAIIVFAENLGGTLTLSPALGQLSLSSPVSILGPGARALTVSGGGALRVFGVSGGPHLISGITISGGKVTAMNQSGGGISSSGDLVIQDCSISGNQVQSPAYFVSSGGGIFVNGGTLTLVRSSVSGNTATGMNVSGNRYGYDAMGAGVHVASGIFTARSSTFQGNTATGGSGTSRTGWACGGIYNNGTTVLRNCTVSGNTATATDAPGIGGIFSAGGNCTLSSTVVAANTVTGYARHRDVRGAFTSDGYNFIGATNGFPAGEHEVRAFAQATDLTGTEQSPRDPKLGAFQSNGGSTNTMLPLADSPLVDQGKTTAEALDDQRGRSRFVDDAAIPNAAGGDGADIGAVEYGAPIDLPTIEFTAGGAVIRLKGERGMNHTFEYSDDLDDPWTPFGGVIFSDGGGNLTVLDPFNPGPRPPRRFYRAVPAP
ncbi:CSLREA domain-containing protein [Luteolibacter sp. SL250]|uniref:CSLREA domain-containing protein n=1 Tax=Luteolibacter sp. SL250 TaxID=2995170 RepID=UPI002270E919|nr:CSLREA domain-containing protein [Luteolibacter sp. SL250]WAC18682.1 CSLREA domain-containing protein [Luteolibacter sp. SL250]